MIIRSLDYYLEPFQVAAHVAERPDFAFLDSSDHQHGHGRCSIIALEPFLKFSYNQGQSQLSFLRHTDHDRDDSSSQITDELFPFDLINQFTGRAGDPFGTLRKLLAIFQIPEHPAFPIPLGASIGYISYDLGASLEAEVPLLDGFQEWPQMEWRFYDTLLIFDHRQRIITLVSTGFPFQGAQQDQWAQLRFSRFLALLEKISAEERDFEENGRDTGNSFSLWQDPADLLVSPQRRDVLRSNFTAVSYQESVKVIKEYIARGDVYQVNLSQQFSCESEEAGFDIYRKIRRVNRVPYGGYLRFGHREILCFSMECFLRMEGRKVQTRPIKGTLPRGKTRREDLAQARKLWQSEKDRAELLMVVDMERNDLGKVCDYHTVRVDRLFEVEKYATVFHLVSTVSGRLRPEFDHLDCLLACFPGGSITGTPKIRAMQVIAELEKIRRGVYCGALGYFGFNRISDFNIPIRTILKQGPRLWFNAGGGVVADSDPYLEYLETLHKVRAFLACLLQATSPVPGEIFSSTLRGEKGSY